MDWGEILLTLLLDLVITVFFYLVAPVIFCLRKKSLTKKQIKTIVIVNGIVVWLIFQILTLELTGEASSGAAVLLWSFVAYKLLKRYCLAEDEGKEESPAEPDIAEKTTKVENSGTSKTEDNVQMSLSPKGEIPKKYGNYNIYGADVRFNPEKCPPPHFDNALLTGTSNESLKLESKAQKSKRSKIILLTTGIVVVFLVLLIAFLVPQYKYNYVLEHNNNYDLTTFEYLKDLKKRDYKDSANIYSNLYDWEVTVVVNSSEDNLRTNVTSIRQNAPIYFHYILSGGEPNESIRLGIKAYFSDGSVVEDTFEEKSIDGETGWFGWPDGFATYDGTIRCYFYDESGAVIGGGSVKITE